MNYKEYWYWLCNIDNIGLKKIEAIINYYETPENAFYADSKSYKQILLLSEKDHQNIIESRNITLIQDNYAKLSRKGIYFVTKDDKEYPSKLKNIYNPPFALYVKGSLPKEDKYTIAVIGARNCSDYGREMALYLSRELANEGIQIVSGLARGIDGYAHEGALSADGFTYGIEGCGVDICYPKENFNLYLKMQDKGGVISEYAPGVNPIAGNFPMRNRIISGISDGILVIEAKEKSGSLITVDLGLDQGKNIYALPGRSYDLLSQGCNNLIKIGAKLVSEPADILEDYIHNYKNCDKKVKKIDKLLETKEKIVYACLSLKPKHMNELVSETSLNIVELSEILLKLEENNYIKQTNKNYYICIT